jgi:hypothetical protein
MVPHPPGYSCIHARHTVELARTAKSPGGDHRLAESDASGIDECVIGISVMLSRAAASNGADDLAARCGRKVE